MAESKMRQPLEKIARQLDDAGITWAVFAGAAATVYGVTRPLIDVDILVPVAEGSQTAALFPEAQMEHYQDWTVDWIKLPDFDILAGLTVMDLDAEMAARLTRHEIAGVSVPVISPEDNIFFKANLGRGPEVGKHDWEDVEAMMAHLPSIDWEYLRWRAEACVPQERAERLLERLETLWNQLHNTWQIHQSDANKSNLPNGGKSMSRVENFGETQNVEVTVLVDNRADLMVTSTDTVKRYKDEPLLAEHGFAALIELKDAETTILWDAGISSTALTENVERMAVDLTTIDKIALSHGHHDHYAAMTNVLQEIAGGPDLREWDGDVTAKEINDWMASLRVPFIAHPAAFRERWGIDDEEGKKYGPRIVPRAEWETAGANVILSEGPYQLGPGCWTTGAVPRRSFEKAGTPSYIAYREGDEFTRDYLDDDQSIIINLEDKGLVIITGCAHSGIVNTVNYAKEISGVDKVWAILGGFHLGRAKDDEIQRTIDEIKKVQPTLIAPSHCTGFKAISQFSIHMPDEFVLGVVGTKYLF